MLASPYSEDLLSFLPSNLRCTPENVAGSHKIHCLYNLKYTLMFWLLERAILVTHSTDFNTYPTGGPI